MSKFWGGGDSSDEEPAQEEISEDEKPVARQVNEKRFATAFIDDSDSGNELCYIYGLTNSENVN